MRLAMIGAGYVGLTSGACLARLGHHVTIFDIDEDRISGLQRFHLPIFEPGLEQEMRRASVAGRLAFTSSAAEAVSSADAVFIAVGTPSRQDGSIDLGQVEAAARMVAPHLLSGAVVVVKSTVGVGTCALIREIIADARGSLDVSVASNPEFLREGSACRDFLEPDRVVIGFDDARAGGVLGDIYAPMGRKLELVETTTANAELIKHAANALLAVKIGFINEVANLCERVGADIDDVARGVGLDRRIGSAFLAAGPGFGGSCFPKDTRAFAEVGRRHGAPLSLVEAVVRSNDVRRRDLARRIIEEAGVGPGARVAILGVAFKANTDDVRESAAAAIAPILLDEGIEVRFHDPKAARNGQRAIAGGNWYPSVYEAAQGTDAVVLLTEWDEYRALDVSRLAAVMSGRHVFDFRNLLSPEEVTRSGLTHHPIGRAASLPEPRTGVRAGRPRGGRATTQVAAAKSD